MKFCICYRVNAGESWKIAGENTRSKNTMVETGWMSCSSQYSSITYISDRKLSTTDIMKCYNLLPSDKVPPPAISKWEASATISTSNMFGPASLLNRVVVYPCSRYKCKVCCSCKICRQKYQENVKQETDQMEEHKIYHKAWHVECVFCNELFRIVPAFKFILHVSGNIQGTRVPYDQAVFKHYAEVSREPKEEKVKCKMCDITFTCMESQIRHYKSIHTKETYSCEKCTRVFNRPDKLKAHIDEVHDFELKCSGCKTVFKSYRSYVRHRNAKFYPDGATKHNCEECGEGFCNPRFLMKHKKKHRFTCFDCSGIFGRAKELAIHKKSIKVSCNLCKLTLCNSKKLIIHNAKIHG